MKNQIVDSETLQAWRESAPHWTRHGATIRTMFAPLTEALIKEAGVVQGQSVLDIAGGAGEPSLTIAQRIAPTGVVTCTDAVAQMVAAAESEARRLGLTNMTFRQCVADSLPFDGNLFDAVVCRLGIMFFPDPRAALIEMLRVTKPGGCVALAVWGSNELNPFMSVIADIMSRHVEAPAADPDAPGAFRFAEPGKLAGILRDAGADEVREQVLQFRLAAPISPGEYWKLRSEVSDTLREKLAKLSAAEVLHVAQEVQEGVRGYFPNDQMSFPAQMIVVTGRKRDQPSKQKETQ